MSSVSNRRQGRTGRWSPSESSAGAHRGKRAPAACHLVTPVAGMAAVPTAAMATPAVMAPARPAAKAETEADDRGRRDIDRLGRINGATAAARQIAGAGIADRAVPIDAAPGAAATDDIDI